MCRQDDETPQHPLPISHGAAMAHGCCSGYRREPPSPLSEIIPLERLRQLCRGDYKERESDEDDTRR